MDVVNLSSLAENLTALHCEHLREMVRLGEAVSARGEDGVLICLLMSEGTMLSGELMKKTGLSSGRIANILRQLEKKGLIVRLPDQSDGRKVHVQLTGKGSRQASMLRRQTNNEHERMLYFLGAEDAETLVRIIRRLFLYAQEHPLRGEG